MLNIIEIGQDYCIMWREKKGIVAEPEQISLPKLALKNPQHLADSIKDIPKGKVIFLLNISQTNVSLLSDANIPNHFNSDEYINSQAPLPDGRFWLTTIPAYISINLVEMCRIKKIRIEHIQAIDTLEYRMTNYCYQQLMTNMCLFLPLNSGIRLIAFDDNGVCSHHYFSNNPKFREKELSRIYQHLDNSLQDVIILSNNPIYDWLYNFDKGLRFDDNLKEKMITWYLG